MADSVGPVEQTRQLLRLPPAEAVAQMLARVNAVVIPPGALDVGAPVALDATLTEVDLVPRMPVSGLDEQLVDGVPISFQYHRVPLDAFFSGWLDGFRPSYPTTTQVLLNELTRRTGQIFDDTDIVQEWIDEARAVNYVLKAKADSHRWVGNVTIALDTEGPVQYQPPVGAFIWQAALGSRPNTTRVGYGVLAEDDSVDFIASIDLPGSPVARKPGFWVWGANCIAALITRDETFADVDTVGGLVLLGFDQTEYLQRLGRWQSTTEVGNYYIDAVLWNATTALVLTADNYGTQDRLYAVDLSDPSAPQTIASVDLGLNGLYSRGCMVLHGGLIVVSHREEGVQRLKAVAFDGTAFTLKHTSAPIDLRFSLPDSYLVSDGLYLYLEHHSVFQYDPLLGFILKAQGDQAEAVGPLQVIASPDSEVYTARLLQLGYNNFKVFEFVDESPGAVYSKQMRPVLSDAVNFDVLFPLASAPREGQVLVLDSSVSFESGVYRVSLDYDASSAQSLLKKNNTHLPGSALAPGSSVAFIKPTPPINVPDLTVTVMDGLNTPPPPPPVLLSGLDYPDEAPPSYLSGLDYP